jgi:glycosyltransferase involved in cell wall biosynthesis
VAATFDVDLVTLGEAGAPPLEAEIVPGLREIRVPKSEPYRRAERTLQAAAGHPPTLEVVPALLLDRVPAYTDFLARSLDGAALVVASHPYCLPAIEACRGRTPLVYDAHNVEATLKETLVGTATQARAALVDRVHSVEGEACRRASLVLACSADDAAALAARHGIPAERIRLAPNGVDTTALATAPAERHARRLALGIADARIAVFVGSWYPPNVEAAEAVFALATKLPQLTFLLAGRVCLAVADRPRPPNLALMGTVDEPTLASLLGLADVALNPTREGSGTHLKMATYLAAGLPVVTTPVGARGYDLVDGEHALVCPLDEFAARIAPLVGDPALAARLSAAGRRLAQERYDWSAIGAEVRTHFDALLAA